MGVAHDASIIEQVKMAQRCGGKVMCDVMLCPDKAGRAKEAQEMGVDVIIVHTGFDEPMVIASDAFTAATDDFEGLLREIVAKGKGGGA